MKVKNTRNFYTHFDTELKEKGKVAEGAELALMLCQMRSLLEICFLKDLGIEGAPISRIIEKIKNTRVGTLLP